MRGAFLVLGLLASTGAASAASVAVMDASSAGLSPSEVAALVKHVRESTTAALKGTEFTLSPPAELTQAMTSMPGCRVGSCDMQVARRPGRCRRHQRGSGAGERRVFVVVADV